MGCQKITYHYSESALEEVPKHFLRVSGKNGVRGKKGTNLYPFGSIARTSKTNEDNHYRYGYQGEFSEEDEETSWNSFELRMLDPVIGRWLSPDPMREFASPYAAMGNNPVNKTDPTGGCTTCPTFRKVTQWDVTKGMVNLEIKAHVDLGFQVGLDIGVVGIEGDGGSAVLVKGVVTFYYDIQNNAVLWDVQGSSIFVDIAEGRLNMNAELKTDLAIFRNKVEHKGDLVQNIKNFDFQEFIDAPLTALIGKQSDEHGATLAVKKDDGSFAIGQDWGAQFIIGGELSIWLNIPEESASAMMDYIQQLVVTKEE